MYRNSDVEIGVNFFGKINEWRELPRPDEIYDYEKYTKPDYIINTEEDLPLENKSVNENKKKKKKSKKDGYKGNVYNLKDSKDNSFVIITMDNISYLTSDENTINQLSDLSITKNNSINNSISNILNNNTLNDSLNEINTNDKNNSLYDSLEIVNDKKRNTISKNTR